jgi:hypothetical protein
MMVMGEALERKTSPLVFNGSRSSAESSALIRKTVTALDRCVVITRDLYLCSDGKGRSDKRKVTESREEKIRTDTSPDKLPTTDRPCRTTEA